MLSQPPWKDQTDRWIYAEKQLTYTMFVVYGHLHIVWCLKMAITCCHADEVKEKKYIASNWWGQKNMLKWLPEHVGHVNIHLGLQKLEYIYGSSKPFYSNKNRNFSLAIHSNFGSCNWWLSVILTSSTVGFVFFAAVVLLTNSVHKWAASI